MFDLFMALDLHWQWQVGMSNARWAAPDPASALAVMVMQGVKKRHRHRLFNELCEMEQAALAVLNPPDG